MSPKGLGQRLLLAGVGLLVATVLSQCGMGRGQNRDQDWDRKMSSLGQVFSELLPRITRTGSSLSTEDWSRIQENADRLTQLAHEVDQKAKTGILSRDPALGYISGLFQRETARAAQALRSGDRDSALKLLRDITGHCLACHTQSSAPEALPEQTTELNLQELDALERAHFLAATRRFDAALDQFERVIADTALLEARDRRWSNAARWALSIAVRVKKSPERALRLIETILARPQVPLYYQEYARAWERSLREWMNETSTPVKDTLAALSEAQRLIDKADSLRRYPADHTGDIFLLRALSILHHQLQKEPRGERGSQLLLAAGHSYEVLAIPQTWPIHEIYYEACIRNLPHSELAKSCFLRLERAIDYGYSGSGGTSIPEGVQNLISELEELSHSSP